MEAVVRELPIAPYEERKRTQFLPRKSKKARSGRPQAARRSVKIESAKSPAALQAKEQASAQARVQSPAQVLAQAQVRSKRRFLLLLLTAFTMTLALASLLFFALLSYNETTEKSQDIRILQKEIESLKAEEDSLEMQLEPFASKERIEPLAKHRLGMTYPSEQQILSLDVAVPEPKLLETANLPSHGMHPAE